MESGVSGDRVPRGLGFPAGAAGPVFPQWTGMKSCLALLLALALLGGCAAPAVAPLQPQTLLHDAWFGAPTEAIDTDGLFALSEPMRRYLAHDIARELRSAGRQRGLIDALYRRGQLKLEYDATTRTAAQAFEARAGNCLSLVVMTAAFAKALDLDVTYQSVDIEDVWSRSGGIAFLNGHVNVTLGNRRTALPSTFDARQALLTIDFLPGADVAGRHTRPISEETVVAMYANNRAAEALADGRLDDAYAWARHAVLRAPDHTASVNTLAVVYLRHGDLPAAEAALQQALQAEPRSRQALANLAVVLDRLGRSAEAEATRARLARLEPYAPYRDFDLGLAAMQRGDYALAQALFAREVARAEDDSEFRYWLGIAQLRLGDVDAARHQLRLALDHSTRRGERERYAAKLERLQATPSR